MQKVPGTIFSLSLVTSHGYNNILISMKKDAGHISVNTVRATFLLHKWMVVHTCQKQAFRVSRHTTVQNIVGNAGG